jgi:hypothetical protein
VSEHNPPFNFHLEEYKSLRQEAQEWVKESTKIQTMTVTAVALVYVWLVKEAPRAQEEDRWIWAVPSVIVMLAALRDFALFNRLKEISAYIALMEERYTLVPDERTQHLCGWERWLKPRRDDKPLIARSIYTFWILFEISTLLAPFHEWRWRGFLIHSVAITLLGAVIFVCVRFRNPLRPSSETDLI